MRISTATPKTRFVLSPPTAYKHTLLTQITSRSHQYGHGHNGNQMPPGPVPGAHTPAVAGWGMPPPQFYNQPAYNPMQPMNQFTDPNNTTVFVGGLSGYVTEDELRSFFQGFGEITYVKIPPGKGCGFVQFVHRHAAEMAINQMQGYPIGNSRVRLSWGRSQNNSGVGTPYRPAPPPPHYMGAGMPPHAGGPAGPYGPQHFGANPSQGPPPGAMQVGHAVPVKMPQTFSNPSTPVKELKGHVKTDGHSPVNENGHEEASSPGCPADTPLPEL